MIVVVILYDHKVNAVNIYVNKLLTYNHDALTVISYINNGGGNKKCAVNNLKSAKLSK